MSNLLWTIDSSNRQRLTGYLPKDIFHKVFITLLSRRGAQIYVIHRFFSVFVPALLSACSAEPDIDPHDHADILLSRLNFNRIPTPSPSTEPLTPA